MQLWYDIDRMLMHGATREDIMTKVCAKSSGHHSVLVVATS